MKATDRYSRSTTKKAIATEKDPYMNLVAPADMSFCSGCNAIYHNKRWRLATEAELKESSTLAQATCPSCHKISDNFAGGYVTLKGEFLVDHKDEILNLIWNNEDLARHNNPLDRIIEIKDKGEVVEVMTTTDKFAQRLGRIIGKSYSGSVEYKWSDDVRIARVTWVR